MHGFRSALRTLTLIPVRVDPGEEMGRALPWFPVVGLIVGAALYAVDLVFRSLPVDLWPGGVALLMVGTETWITRGLHLDGLGDWADSLGGYFDRERRLAIMKDVHIGAFGVAALVMDLLGKWVACAQLSEAGKAHYLLPIAILSRGMLVWLITTLPYARPGEGMGRPFVQGATNGRRYLALGACLAGCLPFGYRGIGLFALAFAVVFMFGARCRRTFGGITGDLLGTAHELTEIILLMVCAFFLRA